MAQVELICGKICSGKSTYAKTFLQEEGTVALSCDEAMHMLEDVLCDDFDAASRQMRKYLHKKAVDLAKAGCRVVLDWGFWTRAEREAVSAYYARAGVSYRWHYIDVSDTQWERQIQKRNAAVLAGEVEEYLFDTGLRAKLRSRFEVPERSEIDVWVEQMEKEVR